MHTSTMFSLARQSLCLAIAVSVFSGCGSSPLQVANIEGEGVVADATLNSMIEDPDWGTFELLATGQNPETGKFDFVVHSTRSVRKNLLRFVWDFGNGPEGEGLQQSYEFVDNGIYLISVTAYGLDNSIAFVLKLTLEIGVESNQAPIARINSDEQFAENDLVFLYGGSSSDPDGDEITYEWVQLRGPPVQILHAREASASFIAPLVDTDQELEFRLTVSDAALTGYGDVVVVVSNLLDPAGTSDEVLPSEIPVVEVPAGVDLNGDGTVNTQDAQVICIPSTPVWRNLSFAPQRGTFEIGFNAIPKSPFMDAIVGLSAASSAQFSDSAVLIRFNPGGTIDVRNGGAYDAASLLPYTVDQTYQFRVVVNVQARTYSVLVTPLGANEISLAIDYAFRTEQNTAATLGFWNLWSETGTTLNLCNLRLTPFVISANAGADITVSPGGSAALNGTAIGGQGPYAYRWSPATGLSNALISNPIAAPSTTTTYTLTVTDIWGSSSTDTVTVNVRAAMTLTANAGADKQINAGGSTPLAGSASGGTAPYTYKWSPSAGLSSTVVANPSAAPSATTTYTLTVTDSAGNSGTDAVTVTVIPLIAALTANAGPDRQIIEGGSTQLSGSAAGGTPPYSYQWSPGTGLSNTIVATPTAGPTATTTYTLTVTDNAAQQASDQVVVTVSTVPTPTGNVFIVANGAANASDSNPGTEAAPWKTLARAAGVARAGHTVLVKAGIYFETLKPLASGTAGNLITFKAYPGDECKGSFAGTKSDCRVIIDGQNNRANGITAYPRKFIRFEGFEIRNHADDGVYLQGYYDATCEGLEVVNNFIHHNRNDAVTFRGNSHTSLIENNEITANLQTGISFGGGSGHTLRGNNIHYNGKDGMRGGGDHIVIEFNKLYDQFHTDLHPDGMDLGDMRDSILRYNTLYDFTQLMYFHDFDNGGGFINLQIYGNVFYTDRYWTVRGGEAPAIFFDASFHNSPITNVKIHSNTFLWTGYKGIIMYGGPLDRVAISDNIFFDSGIDLDGRTTGVTSNYNIFQNSRASINEGPNSLTTNPQFVSHVRHQSWNVHLKSTSPAINKGDPALLTTMGLTGNFEDIDRVSRPSGVRCDIGAYEYKP